MQFCAVKLRSSQQFSDRHLEKLLSIIHFEDAMGRKTKKKKKRKNEPPFVSISPSSTREPKEKHTMQLRLQKASSMNIPSHHRSDRVKDTPTESVHLSIPN